MSNQLTVIEQADQLTSALREYKPASYNLLLPTTDLRFIAPEHQIVINTVRLDPDDDFWEQDVSWSKQDGQWQKTVTGYALSKRGLRRLMQIAGITTESSRVTWDDEGRATAQVAIKMTGTDGLPRQFIGTYTWNTPARIEEAEQRYQEKIAKEPTKKAKHRKAFEADRARIIKFATSLAETGALNRALRDALTTKSKYSPEEITKPFVCLQVVEPRRPEIDFDHPFVRKLMSMAILNTGHLPAYPGEESKPLPPAFVDPTSDAVAAGEVQAPPASEYEPPAEERIQPVISYDATPEHDEPQDERPYSPERLIEIMNDKLPSPENPDHKHLFRPPSAEESKRMHAALQAITHGDDNKRRRVFDAFYGVSSSLDLLRWQVNRIWRWCGTVPEKDEAGKTIWVPNAHTITEFRDLMRWHEKQAGQRELFEEEGNDEMPGV